MGKLRFSPVSGKVLLTGCLILLSASQLFAQTFFETAKGDGIIDLNSGKKTANSQIKLDLTSSAVGFNWNYAQGNSIQDKRWLFNFTVKAKPDDNGFASIAQAGKFQTGISATGAAGLRFFPSTKSDSAKFSVIDIYIKPEYSFNIFTIYDSAHTAPVLDPVYKAHKNSYGANFLLNYITSSGRFNFFTGAQLGLKRSNNVDDLTDANVQTLQPYPGSASKVLAYDIKEVKKGQLKDVTLAPLKLDLIIDPRLKLSKAKDNSFSLAFFGYYRTDLKADLVKQRIGTGICFLDVTNPSKIFTSIGFEFPTFGSGVTADDKKTNKGIVFATIGYTIK